MAVVVFDPTAFKAQYTEFSGLSDGVLTLNFSQAELMCNNTDTSIVQDTNVRTTLLWLLTAHITKLFNGTNNGTTSTPPSDLVGRVEVAKEGSVHVRADMGTTTQASAWFNQTRYGAMYWAATVRYRTLRYVPFQPVTGNVQGPVPAIQPWPYPWAWGRY